MAYPTLFDHICEARRGDGKLCVFDVAPSSIASKEAKKRFTKEAKAHASVAKFLEPPADPAYHLEITN